MKFEIEGFVVFLCNYHAIDPIQANKNKKVGKFLLQKENLINEESTQSNHQRPIFCVFHTMSILKNFLAQRTPATMSVY